MGDWTTGIHDALEYMEAHLTEELEIREIAKQAYLSQFHCGLCSHAVVPCPRLCRTLTPECGPNGCQTAKTTGWP